MKTTKFVVGIAVLLMAAFATGKLRAAVQIDSFDSTANWTASSGTLTVDSSVKVEGTGSMKIATVGWDNWVTYNIATPGLNLAGQTALTCWVKANYTEPNSSLNIFYVGIWNGSGQHIYYYPGVKPTNTNWTKNTWLLSNFTMDAGTGPFDLTNITQISLLCNTWDHQQAGAYLWVDNLQAENSQIDSFDDLTNWLGLGTQASLDTTTKHEGTGSMKCIFGSGLSYDVAPYKNQNYNFSFDTPVMLTFWEKSARTGSERVIQLICTDTGNHVARYTAAQPPTTDWTKVLCPLSSFVIDSGATFDWAHVRTIQVWFNSWDVMGSAVWIDDLKVESVPTGPKPPFQIASFDDWGTDSWVGSQGASLMVQETTTVKEGTGSMKIAYPVTGVYDVVPRKIFSPAIDFNDYQHQAISIWIWSDMVNDSRLNQFIVYDNAGHTGRYIVPSPASVGWRQVIMPCKNFAWETSVGGAPVTDMNQIKWTNITQIDLWVSDYPNPGNAIYLDDIEALNYVPPVPSQAWVMNAQKVTTPLTIDGNPADWSSLADSDWMDFDLAAVPIQPNGNLHVKYKMAWDDSYLYILVQELPGDALAKEAQGVGAKLGDGLNDGAGGDVYYDNLALWFDFTNSHTPGLGTDISLWLFCGLSSTNRTDMLMAWTNGNWGPHDSAAITNAACATSGTLGSRVFEAKVKWSDLASDIQVSRLPAAGLLSQIKPGYVFGCDPRLNDLEGDWNTVSSEVGAAWFNGKLWTNVPSGKDVYSTDVRLVCKAADLTGDCSVNFADFAKFAAQWLMTGCNDLNGYCGGADIVMDNVVNPTDLKKFADEWLK